MKIKSYFQEIFQSFSINTPEETILSKQLFKAFNTFTIIKKATPTDGFQKAHNVLYIFDLNRLTVDTTEITELGHTQCHAGHYPPLYTETT